MTTYKTRMDLIRKRLHKRAVLACSHLSENRDLNVELRSKEALRFLVEGFEEELCRMDELEEIEAKIAPYRRALMKIAGWKNKSATKLKDGKAVKEFALGSKKAFEQCAELADNVLENQCNTSSPTKPKTST